MSVIPELGRLRQEDCENEANLGYIVILSQRNQKMKKRSNFKTLLSTLDFMLRPARNKRKGRL
jgi:hypothetical protein